MAATLTSGRLTDALAASHALVALVQRLRRQHRAGINECSGQLDELFELADLAARELATAGAGRDRSPRLRGARGIRDWPPAAGGGARRRGGAARELRA